VHARPLTTGAQSIWSASDQLQSRSPAGSTRSAARRAFSVAFSITQRDAASRPSL